MVIDHSTEPLAPRSESERRELLDRLAATFDDPATAGLDWDMLASRWNGPVDTAKLVRAERLRDE